MKHQIKIISTDLIDRFEGTVQFEINGNIYSGFFCGEEFKAGQLIEADLGHLEYGLDWDVIFNENKNKEVKLEQASDSEWSYYGYGKIKSIDPIITDFGDIQLDLGYWTNDQNVIGEYIYWKVERLDISTNND